MDIKGLVRNMVPVATSSAKDARRAVKTDGSTDRDANGQSAGGEQQAPRRQLSQEEIEQAVKHLEGLAGVKDNGLRIRLAQADGVNVVYVEDGQGKVIRRIPEMELAALVSQKEKKNGHLLNRAM